MSEKTKKVKREAATSFAYRNIKKDFTKFKPNEVITKNYHLELGEHNEAKIVEDRPDDWFEIAQIGVDQVGLANILEIARRRGENAFDGRYAFKDDEALDLGDLDAKDPEAVKAAIAAGSAAQQKLEETAGQLGVSVDELIDSMLKGTLATLIKDKTTQTPEGGAE